MGDSAVSGLGADAPAPNATTDATSTQASADAPPVSDEWRNAGEIKAALRDLRTLKAEIATLKASGHAPAKAEPVSDVAELRAELALRDAMSDLGLSPRAKQRAIIASQYRLDRPSDVGAWLEEMSDALSLRPAVAGQTSKPISQVAQTRTDLGAPQREERVIPRDVRQIPSAEWQAMTPVERRDRFNETLRSEGRGNPFFKPLPGAHK